MTREKKENGESNTQEKILQIVEAVKGLKLSEVAELNSCLKETFKISGDSLVTPTSESSSKKEKKEEVVENVSLKFVGLAENITDIAGKLKVYKAISDIAKEHGNSINVIQVKRLVEEQGILLSDISSGQAKEIQSQLEAKGVRISLSPPTS